MGCIISAMRQLPRLAVDRLSAANADSSALQKHDDTQLLGMQLAVKAYRSAVIAAALAGGAVPDGSLHRCHGSRPHVVAFSAFVKWQPTAMLEVHLPLQLEVRMCLSNESELASLAPSGLYCTGHVQAASGSTFSLL